ncbi:glutamate receptor ionotropic, kainate glr-3-like [Penaeus chinensis]|uniref:glutamate receptor ionotropic, kainate glr-3-like n=1 Tax=Penaeus chinensis TaxID=139456 RepID=UPI001FB66CF7|nr:glutamate receptor ionotropic, kainate glr-3-like [Penaeus chinensis]
MALSGRHLSVASDEWIPWVEIAAEDSWGGIAVTVLEILAEKLNFTYHYVRPLDQEWGRKLPNGSFTGLVGMLDRREADLALGPLSISWDRYQRVDFSTFLYMDWWGILLPRPRLERDFAGFLKPFAPEVWLGFGASLLVTIILGVILRTLTPDSLPESKSSFNLAWIARTVMNEATESLPLSVSGRTFLGTWLLAMCVLTSAYSGVLTSLLTVPIITVPVDSVEDLVSYGKIPWNLERGTWMHEGYARSNSKLGKKVFEGAGIVASAWDIRDRIKNERVAVFTGHFNMKKVMHHDYTETGQCNYYIGKVPLSSSLLSMAFPKGSSLVPAFNKWLTSLVETGQVTRLMSDLTSNAKVCMVRPGKEKKANTPLVLTLGDLGGVFFLLVSEIRLSIHDIIVSMGTFKFFRRACLYLSSKQSAYSRL